MPVQFDRDDVARRLRHTITSPISAAELIATVERQLAEGAWSYGLLVDARAMSVPPAPSELRLLVLRVSELVAAHGPRGPIAFVARHAAAIGSVHVYLFLGGRTDSLEVFWDLPEAKEWLDRQMSKSAETPAPS
jgi:hypothetical protein